MSRYLSRVGIIAETLFMARIKIQVSLLFLVALPAMLLAMSLSMISYKRTTQRVPMHLDFGFHADGTAWKFQTGEKAWCEIKSWGWPLAYEWTPAPLPRTGIEISAPRNHRSNGISFPNLVVNLSLGSCVVLVLFGMVSWWLHRSSPSNAQPVHIAKWRGLLVVFISLFVANAWVAFYKTSKKEVPRHFVMKDDGSWRLESAVPDSKVVIRSLGWPFAYFWGPFPDAQETLPYNHRSYHIRWPTLFLNQLGVTTVTLISLWFAWFVLRKYKYGKTNTRPATEIRG